MAAVALEGLCSGSAAEALLASFPGLGIWERPAARSAHAARAAAQRCVRWAPVALPQRHWLFSSICMRINILASPRSMLATSMGSSLLVTVTQVPA